MMSSIQMTSSCPPAGGEVCNESYQLLEAMKAWERGLDTATYMLALRSGCVGLFGSKLGYCVSMHAIKVGWLCGCAHAIKVGGLCMPRLEGCCMP